MYIQNNKKWNILKIKWKSMEYIQNNNLNGIYSKIIQNGNFYKIIKNFR